MSILCEISNLIWQSREKKILDIEKLTIKKGERISLIGANGAGKSSLFKVLTYLEKNIQGNLSYLGFEDKTEISIRRNISAVFQDPNLLRGRVYENIIIGLKLRGVEKKEISRKLDFWLKEFNITHLANRNARTLSKGEAQRVSLARAMITNPKFLLLDEPFSNLDVPTRSEILSELSNITKKQNTTLIMITHFPAEIPVIADRVIVLDEGKLVEDGTPFQVLESPKKRITATLVGIDNVYSGVCNNEKVHIEGMGFLSLNKNYNCNLKKDIFIKPDLIKFHENETYNTFDFTVNKIVPMHDSVNLFSNDMTLTFRLSRHDFIHHSPLLNKKIKIHIPHEAILLGE